MADKKLSVPEFRAKLMGSPSLFAHDIDLSRDAMLFVQLTEQDYRTASFLDNRILREDMTGAWFRLATVSQAISADAPTGSQPHYIFHSGHVGSTLLSRLLDEAPGVMGIREPLILRTLARVRDQAEDDGVNDLTTFCERLLWQQTHLWRRSYSPAGVSIVKATSATARVGAPLLHANSGSRAVCLNVSLDTYLATCLAGENTPADLAGHEPERRRRLEKMFDVSPPSAATQGERAALAWVAESLTHRKLQREFGDRILRVDFDQLLADVSSTLRRISLHFGLSPPDSYFEQAGQSPILLRYAKAPEAAYSPAERALLLVSAREDHSAEIRRGMAWAEALARSSPAVEALFVG